MARKNKRDITDLRIGKQDLKDIAIKLNVPYDDKTPLKEKDNRANVFISYAQEDISFAKKIINRIKELQTAKIINVFTDQEINIAANWDSQINRKLENADIILLIISPNILASDYFSGIEFKKAISMHNAGKTTIIPIILRPCDWSSAPFAKLQVLPRNTQAIALSKNIDLSLTELIDELRLIINNTIPSEGIEDELSIEIKIDANFDKFTKTDTETFLKALKEKLDIKSNIQVSQIKRGSVKINLKLEREEIEVLYNAAVRGELHGLNVISAELLMDSIDNSIEVKPKLRPSVFIGSSSEGIEIAEAIQLSLDHLCEVTIWSQGVFGLGNGTLETLVNSLKSYDYAIMVLTPDDLIYSRDKLNDSPRDNVLFELGLFMGHLGRERTFIIYNRTANIKLPSDLAGVTMATFQPHSTGNLEAALGAPCTKVKKAIKELGKRIKSA